jgi:Fe-S oxidoreductase
VNIPIHLAGDKDLHCIGVDPVPRSGMKEKTLSLMDEYRNFARSLKVMLDTCTRCGACANACHSYLGTDDFFNIPGARAALFRKIYERYFTWAGKTLGKFAGAAEFDTETGGSWVDYFYQCNICRRCAYYCPFGIDTGEVTIAARHILTHLGIAPRFLVNIARNELTTGNNMGMLKPAILDSCAFLEEELREETGLDIKIPVDKPYSEILYVPSSSDLFTNVDTMMGAAKIFHHLGTDWTLSSTLLEAANYGLLFDLDVMKKHNRRLRIAADAVGADLVIQGECGHGWRVARMYSEGANGPVTFKLTHILEYAAANLSKFNLVKLPLRATLHDPCNYGRAAGLLDQPRQIMRACVGEFVEMTPNREMNFCCGGGSGLLMDEIKELRMKLGKMKADQIKALQPLDYVALPCASCKAQVPLLLKHYGMEETGTGGVIELLGRAMVMQGSSAESVEGKHIRKITGERTW